MKKLNQREIIQPAQSHTYHWRGWDLNLCNPKAQILNQYPLSSLLISLSPSFLPLSLSPLNFWKCPYTVILQQLGPCLVGGILPHTLVFSCGCSSPSCSRMPYCVLQGLSVRVICWPSFLLSLCISPVLCALWSWSFTNCLRLSLSLRGAGLFFSGANVISSAATPWIPSWVVEYRLGIAVTPPKMSERPEVLLRSCDFKEVLLKRDSTVLRGCFLKRALLVFIRIAGVWRWRWKSHVLLVWGTPVRQACGARVVLYPLRI